MPVDKELVLNLWAEGFTSETIANRASARPEWVRVIVQRARLVGDARAKRRKEPGWTKPVEARFGFHLGDRVKVNGTFTYGRHGEEGTVVKIPNNKEWLGVRFDGSENVTEWHHTYFDLIRAGAV